MRQTIFWAAISALVLQGCNKSSDDNAAAAGENYDYDKAPTAASGEMSETTAIEFKDGMGKAVLEETVKNLSGTQAVAVGNAGTAATVPSTGETFSMTEGDATGCEMQTTAGDTTDADSDLILDDITRTIDCDTTEEFYSWKATGTIKWFDKDTTKNPGGFTLTYGPYHAEYTMKMEAHDTAYITDTLGKFDVTRDGKTITAATENGSHVNVTVKTTKIDYVFGSFYTQTFEAADETKTGEAFFADGTVTSLSGFYRWQMVGEGASEGQSETGSMNQGWVLKMEGANLVRKSTCTAATFDSGELKFTDGSGNVIKAMFENCVAKWTYNDKAI